MCTVLFVLLLLKVEIELFEIEKISSYHGST